MKVVWIKSNNTQRMLPYGMISSTICYIHIYSSLLEEYNWFRYMCLSATGWCSKLPNWSERISISKWKVMDETSYSALRTKYGMSLVKPCSLGVFACMYVSLNVVTGIYSKSQSKVNDTKISKWPWNVKQLFQYQRFHRFCMNRRNDQLLIRMS